MAGWRILVGVSIFAIAAAQAAPHRILYCTATYGFRHGSIETSIQVMQELAQQSGGVFEVDNTEDVSLINAENLRNYDAVYFFTSGELPLSDQQKADLLDFIRQGKGFGGSHSATDTLYTWPEYGDLIGGIFDGHPWTQEASEDVEDPDNPIVRHLAPSFRALEEYYQFRNFSRDNVRVLLTLNTGTVDLSADGVNRTDGDFASVWVRRYGQGRVFYSAFGHFDESFTLPMFRTMLQQALLWLVGEIDLDATPRSGPSAPAPALTAAGVTTPGGRNDAFAPGAIVQIAGDRLTSGSSLAADSTPLPARLAGTHVEVNGLTAPLFSVSPGTIMAQLPVELSPGSDAALTVSSVNRAGKAVTLHIDSAAPGILTVDRVAGVLEIYATGLGATNPTVTTGSPAPAQPLASTRITPSVSIGGRDAVVQFSGLAPGWIGVNQVNAVIPPDAAPDSDGTLPVVLQSGGRQSAVYRFQY
jgi:type 1 glutamine amidotransferase